MTKNQTPLQAELAWESGQTDPDRKPLRMIELQVIRLENNADDNARYFAAFEGVTTETVEALKAELEANPEWVHAARDTTLAKSYLGLYVGMATNRGTRSAGLVVEWLEILADRYPKAGLRELGYVRS